MRGTNFLHRDPDDVKRLVSSLRSGDLIFAFETHMNWGFFEVGAIWLKNNSFLVEIDPRSFDHSFHSGISVDFYATLTDGREVHAVAGEDVRAVYKTRDEAEVVRDQVRAAVDDYNNTLEKAKLKLDIAIAIVQQIPEPE